jgi:hypothetical protein
MESWVLWTFLASWFAFCFCWGRLQLQPREDICEASICFASGGVSETWPISIPSTSRHGLPKREHSMQMWGMLCCTRNVPWMKPDKLFPMSATPMQR